MTNPIPKAIEKDMHIKKGDFVTVIDGAPMLIGKKAKVIVVYESEGCLGVSAIPEWSTNDGIAREWKKIDPPFSPELCSCPWFDQSRRIGKLEVLRELQRLGTDCTDSEFGMFDLKMFGDKVLSYIDEKIEELEG